MTTYTAFTPTAQAAWQFQPTLDGNTYTVIATWNIYRQDYYISIYDLSGNMIVMLPLIGSPPDSDINLVAGYFTTSTLVFRVSTQQFEVTP